VSIACFLRCSHNRQEQCQAPQAVLERCGPLLAVSRLTDVTWCDWGSPRRVVRSLQQIGWRPAWLETFTASRLA
jgi:hypothetical protein